MERATESVPGVGEALVYEAIRTPRGRGRAEGALAGVSPIRLVGGLLAALTRRGLDPERVDDVVLGCVTQVGEQGTDIARMAVLVAGWPDAVPGATVSRFCTSGLDAVTQSAARVMAGMDALIVAGGVESMSRVPMFSDKGAWFADPEVARQTRFVHMGLSADLIAARDGRSREALDAWALRSHQRAWAAWEEGRFDQSVVPVCGPDGAPLLSRDERVRPELTMEALAQRPASFAQLGQQGGDDLLRAAYPDLAEVPHLHTSGTSPGIVDGAALVVVGSRSAGEAMGLRPRARILSFAQAAVDPVLMLTGTVPATQKALARAGLSVEDIDLWEINESFSAPVLHVVDALGLDPATVNIDGGAIAMGHPLGATGAMLVGTLVDALTRRGGGRGVVSLCGGAGVASAAVIAV